MSATITSGATVIAPSAVTGYDAARAGSTLVHPILGNPNPDATLRPAQLRTGTLTLVFIGATSEADSKTAVDLFATAATFTLASTDRTTIGMTFVVPVTGSARRSLSTTTGTSWTVVVDFQEVVP